jgi:hypothetical protein
MGNRRFITFASHHLRFLGREAKVVQDTSQMIGMIRHTKSLSYELSYAPTGPEFRAIASGTWTLLE